MKEDMNDHESKILDRRRIFSRSLRSRRPNRWTQERNRTGDQLTSDSSTYGRLFSKDSKTFEEERCSNLSRYFRSLSFQMVKACSMMPRQQRSLVSWSRASFALQELSLGTITRYMVRDRTSCSDQRNGFGILSDWPYPDNLDRLKSV